MEGTGRKIRIQDTGGQEVVSNDRVGFVRLETKRIIVDKEELRPQWHMVTSIENGKKSVGRLLVNARIVAKTQKIKRLTLPESKDVQYWFFP